jgi:hypothetical protein
VIADENVDVAENSPGRGHQPFGLTGFGQVASTMLDAA